MKLLQTFVVLTVKVGITFSWNAGASHEGKRWIPCGFRGHPTKLWDVNDSNSINKREGSGNQDSLLERAAKLRKEATELEASLQRKQRDFAPPLPDLYSLPVYQDIKDSIWTFSYRFSNEPEPKEDNTDLKRAFYAGKLCLKFRADGYTDVVAHQPGSSSAPLHIEKAWGWDLETSNEDDNDYLMFSIDFRVPDQEDIQRFYFQIRKVMDRTNLLLKEGTVTIKQDVVESNSIPGRWGFFSPRGILAKFRYVGDFAVTKTLSSLLS